LITIKASRKEFHTVISYRDLIPLKIYPPRTVLLYRAQNLPQLQMPKQISMHRLMLIA